MPKIFLAHHDRRGIVIGMKTQGRCVLQVFIQKQVDMVLHIVYKPERGDRPGPQAQPAFHALCGCERKFPLAEALLKVVYGEVLFAVEHDEIVSVPLVVAKEEVFAVCRTVLPPMLFCDLDRWRFGMVVAFVGDAACGEEVVCFLLSVVHYGF